MADDDRVRAVFHGAVVMLVGPSTNPVLMFAFVANATGMFGSVLTASLTMMGARVSLRPTVTA